MKALIPILIIAALLIGYTVGSHIGEVVCDHPEFNESGFAAISATCQDGIVVTILD